MSTPVPDDVDLVQDDGLIIEVPAVARPNGWLTIQEIRQLWADAPADDFQLELLLESARLTCIEHSLLQDQNTGKLRHWAADDPVPADYLTAQRLQTVAIWRITQTSVSEDTIGFDQTAVRVWPMNNDIRQLLRRPRRPVVA